jgi:hypothetical protein
LGKFLPQLLKFLASSTVAPFKVVGIGYVYTGLHLSLYVVLFQQAHPLPIDTPRILVALRLAIGSSQLAVDTELLNLFCTICLLIGDQGLVDCPVFDVKVGQFVGQNQSPHFLLLAQANDAFYSFRDSASSDELQGFAILLGYLCRSEFLQQLQSDFVFSAQRRTPLHTFWFLTSSGLLLAHVLLLHCI